MSNQPNVHQLYKRLETVGKGAYGSVHKGVELATGNIVALKIINLDTADDDVADIQREVALLAQLRDAVNTTKYYGCYLDGPRVWIVMDYASGGSVRTLMKSCKDSKVEEKYVVVIIRELLLALSYIHKMGVIHRDIKAANILVTAVGKVVLCDFGVSALLNSTQSKRNTFIGTPHWMAPEVAQSVPAYDTRADIWSTGITIFETVTGNVPYSDVEHLKVLHLIPRSAAPRLPESEGSKDMRDFVALCLKEAVAERPSADELQKTKWIKSSKAPVSILKDLLIRYDNWHQGGGSRTSIADPLPWEEEESEDIRGISNEPRGSWVFDTIKSGDLHPPEANGEDSYFEGGQPIQQKRLPTSLRNLFQEEPTLPSDTFHLHAFGQSRTKPSSSPSLALPILGREWGGSQMHDLSGSNQDEFPTARPTEFSFPPKKNGVPKPSSPVPPPAPAPGSTSSHGSDSDSLDVSRPMRRYASIGRGIGGHTMSSSGSSLSLASQDSSAESGATVKPTATYGQMLVMRNVPDISVLTTNEAGPSPPSDRSTGVMDTPSSSSATEGSATSLEPPTPTNDSRSIFNRKRSQSSAPAPSSTSRSPRSIASPNDFQFPGPAIAAALPGPSLPPLPPLSKTHNRISPTHISTSSSTGAGNRSSGGHQSMHSLDDPNSIIPSGRNPNRDVSMWQTSGKGLGLPPSLSRAFSATAIIDGRTQAQAHTIEYPTSATTDSPMIPPRRPTISRQTSLMAMDAAAKSARSAPAFSLEGESLESPHVFKPQIPDLKDVLKLPSAISDIQLSMPDLLPPSPSVGSSMPRNVPVASLPTAPAHATTHVADETFQPPTRPFVRSGTPTSPRLRNRTPSPPPPPSAIKFNGAGSSAGDVSTKSTPSTGSRGTVSHGTSSSSSSLGLGPLLRPLDLGPLISSHDNTHAELAKTVDELTKWLNVVETGLTSMLDRFVISGGDDTRLGVVVDIEETEEDTDTDIDQGYSGAASDATSFSMLHSINENVDDNGGDEELHTEDEYLETSTDSDEVINSLNGLQDFLSRLKKDGAESDEDVQFEDIDEHFPDSLIRRGWTHSQNHSQSHEQLASHKS